MVDSTNNTQKEQTLGTSSQERSEVIRTERGWAGHFICADRCLFRRNTLLECNGVRIVVSSVGLMVSLKESESRQYEEIGLNRYFETMAFLAEHDGRYWDADVSKEISFESPWAISEIDADDRANDMHEDVVKELSRKLSQGKCLRMVSDSF